MVNLLTEKINMFKEGRIVDGGKLINADSQLLKDSHAVLDKYWNEPLKYTADNFLSPNDLVQPSNLLPIKGTDFNLDHLDFNVHDLASRIGIDDLESALNMAPGVIDTVNDMVTDFSGTLKSGIDMVTAPVTTAINDVQHMLNGYIDKAQNFISPGLKSLIGLNCNFIDFGDASSLYKKFYTSCISMMNLNFSAFKIDNITNGITDIIKNANIMGIAEKLDICKNIKSLYSKLSDGSIFSAVVPYLKQFIPMSGVAERIVSAVNKLMPSSMELLKKCAQFDLMKTSASLMKEIDIFRTASIKKGLANGGLMCKV